MFKRSKYFKKWHVLPLSLRTQTTLICQVQSLLALTLNALRRSARFILCWITRPSPYATRPLFQRSNSMRMLPACPYPVATPRSPELTLTREGNHHILQPVKLNFSPISQNNQAPEEHTPIHGLMYHNTQALRESPRLISSVDAIYCSTILQENINHLLADHALDVTKTRQTARYLGIKEEVFFTYIRETYPKHYWAQLGNKQ